ncbi:MAG: ATP-binding cassette domain-containing protein [Pseudomonadota bacterium]|nr:ATP-binding cassette domain-containing protein [Pseudomonadota bacterium]MEE3099951.1 ATP-binding cassette domain-containing protein [Pseudomonadota bacterium]
MTAALIIRDAEIRRGAAPGELGFRLEVEALDVGFGERLGLVGPSGAGKSTLLELAALLAWPTRVGRFDLCGRSLADLICGRDADGAARERARELAYAPQNGGLLPYLSVRENALLAARLARKPMDGVGPRVETLAARLGIAALLDKRPNRLSGGERQRAAVLRMAVAEARLFLADEPTASLDRANGETVMAALVDAAEGAGAALVCVSHDRGLLERFGFELAEVTAELDAAGTERRARLVRRREVASCA